MEYLYLRYAREQVRRKAESTSVSDDEGNSSEDSGSEKESHDMKKSRTTKDSNKSNNEEEQQNKDVNKDSNKTNSDELCEKQIEATTNGTHSPPPAAIVVSPSLPLASTSAAFRTSPPHAFESPEASPRPSSLSPLLPSCTSSSLKILSVTSLNESADVSSPKKNNDIIKPAAVVGSADEIVISDEDL